jgi:uncharacterized 2Fe-2S/4Fe-4S cluster protein (DUF4445 family)
MCAPKGICGSGLIIMVAVLFEMGVINNQGKFDRDLGTRTHPQPTTAYGNTCWPGGRDPDRPGHRALTEIDIENLIRAKGAIYSGCMTLLDRSGHGHGEDIEQIYSGRRVRQLCGPGKGHDHRPAAGNRRMTFIGLLLGPALTNRIRQDVVEVTRMMTNFELSETASYMDNYVAALFLPHNEPVQLLGARLSALLTNRIVY